MKDLDSDFEEDFLEIDEYLKDENHEPTLREAIREVKAVAKRDIQDLIERTRIKKEIIKEELRYKVDKIRKR